MTQVSKQPASIANFLSFPATSKFLDETLKENKKEFVSNLIAMCDGDANLAACDPKKLMMCAMNATALGLPLNKNLGYAYIIPYKGIPSFQIGFKGIIQLALRSGQYNYINASEVRKGEIVRNKFTGQIKFLGENPENPIVGYLACLQLNNGYEASVYMSEEEIEAHATRYSKMYAADKQYGKRVSKWSDTEERPKMANKTVLKKLLGTYGILSTEMITALSNDDEEVEIPSSGRGTTIIEAEVITQEEPGTNEPEKVEI